MTVKVAVTVGLLEDNPETKVMTQVWLPTVALLAITEALRVAGVDPPPGFRFSQPQSAPSEAPKVKPLTGLVLAREMLCAGGTVPPMV